MSATLAKPQANPETPGAPAANILRLNIDYEITRSSSQGVVCQASDGQEVVSGLPCLTRLSVGVRFYLVAASDITLGLRLR